MGRKQHPKTKKKVGSGVQLEVLVEEESAARLLRKNLRSWIACDLGVDIKVHPFRGKPALMQKLPTLLSGYADLRRKGYDVRVLVLVDQDRDDCVKLKTSLDRMAQKAGMVTRSSARSGAHFVVNRIVVRELENWYFGDWDAAKSAFPKLNARVPAAYRGNADQRDKKTSEVFENTLKAAGIRNASKPDWADRIGPHMDPVRNRSTSFRVFLEGVHNLLKEQT